MKKLFLALWVSFCLVLPSLALAQSVPTPPQTPNIGLYLPEFIPDTWGEDFDLNWKRIDSMFPGGTSAAGAVRVCLSCTPIVPFPTAPTTGLLAVLTDGINGTTCTTGGGTNQNLCQWNGSTWTLVGGSGAGGASTFGQITSGTNTSQTLTVGNGSIVNTSGTGAITATAVPFAGVTGTASDAQIPNLNTLSTGLTASRCVATDGSAGLISSSGDCLSVTTLQAGTPLYCTAANASDTYTCTLTPALTAYTTGMTVAFRSTVTANTGVATLNINGLGPITIVKSTGTTLSDGDIALGAFYHLYYDGTNFRMPQDSGGGGGGGTPGGANTQCQFNDFGVFGGDAGCTYNKTTDVLTVTGGVTSNLTGNVTGNVTGAVTGSVTGAVTGNVTSSGQSTFAGTLIIPGKSDPGTPAVSELWRNTEDLKWYSAATTQRALRDTNFTADGLMMRGAGSGNYSILAPTDDAFAVGNGTIWQAKVMPNCRPSLGQGWSYDNSTNTLGCETIVTTGLASLTEDADSLNATKALEIGVQTNNVQLARGASIVGSQIYTLAKNTAGDVALSSGTLTQNELASYDSAERAVASGTTKWFKAYWDGGAITTDGSNCADASKQTLDTTPQYAFSCGKNAGSIFYGKVALTRAITTATFQLTIFHAASEVITFAGDISAKCRGDGDVLGGSWGTAVAVDITTQALANQVQQATTANVTPNGTCTAGKILHWRWVEDEPNFSANAVNSRVTDMLMIQSQ